MKQQGVAIREYCAAQNLIEQTGQAIAMQTNTDTITADYFIFATGTFTPQMLKQLHCTLSLQPGKGYSISLAYSTLKPVLPMAFPEHNVVITPMDEFYRLGSILEFVGYDKTLTPQRFELLKRSVKEYLKHFPEDTVIEKWCGLRGMTPDGVPYIGTCPKFPNVFVAAGHNMDGITMAPATGKLIAELIADEKPHLDLEPYRLDRHS